MVGARAHGLGLDRVEAGAQWDAQLHTVEEPLVLRDGRVDEAGQLGDGVAAGVAEGRPARDVRTGVGSLEVEDEPVPVDGHRDVDVQVLVSLRIAVDVDVGLVGAVRPAADLVGEPGAGIVDGVRDGGPDGVGAPAGGQSLQPRRPQLGRPDLGAEVADESSEPVVGAHGEDDVPPLVPAVDDLQERVPGALAVDVLGHGVVAAGHRPTGVTVVALDGGHQEELPVVVEDRSEDVEVREVAAAVIGVVGDDDIARLELACSRRSRWRSGPGGCWRA